MKWKILYQGSLSCESIYNCVGKLAYSFIRSAIFDNFKKSLSVVDLLNLLSGTRSDLYRICKKLNIESCIVIRQYSSSPLFVPYSCNCVVVFYFKNRSCLKFYTWITL